MAIMTTSFDIFLSWQLGGTIRFCQVVMIVPYIYFVLDVVKKRYIIIPKAMGWLCLWNLFILAFVLNTDIIARSIGYWVWLTMNIVNILLLVNVFTKRFLIISLLRTYCLSFVVVSMFGLFQFVSAPILHMDTPLVAQWWIPGILARINGFSYEPSYFVTYIIMGWCFLYILVKKKNQDLFSLNYIRLMFGIVTLAIILSGSRMGLLMLLAVQLFIYLYINGKELIRNFLMLKIDVTFIKRIILTLVIILSVGYVFSSDDVFDEYAFFLSGTGIGATAAHSVDDRVESMDKTLHVFYENPVLGVSLGGVAEKITQNENQIDNSKVSEGAVVALEILAASGIVGVIPIIIYFYKIICISIFIY